MTKLTPLEAIILGGTRKNNNRSADPKILDSLEEVKAIVSKVFDSASIHDFEVSKYGTQFMIIVPSDYHVPRICLKQLESNGYSLKTLHGGNRGLEITIGGKGK